MISFWYWYDWNDVLNISLLARDWLNDWLVILDIWLFWLYFYIRYDKE